MNRRNAIKVLSISPLLLPVAQAAGIGDTLVLPAITLIDGTILTPDHWRGKVLIVERFANRRPLCKVQDPKLSTLLRANQSRASTCSRCPSTVARTSSNRSNRVSSSTRIVPNSRAGYN